jgi:hypothetical protein
MRAIFGIWMSLSLIIGASVAHGARTPATLDTTASALFFLESPRAELASPKTLEAIASIKEEVTAVLDARVVTAKHSEFYLPPYFDLGHISVGFTDDMMKKLEALLGANGEIDVTSPLGIPELDTLNAKWKATRYKKPYPFSRNLQVHFDPAFNPRVVADAFGTLASVRWAEPSSLSFIGGGTELSRIAPASRGRNHQPTLYVLSLGWGDCPAGCMAVHRTYYEVYHRPQGVEVKLVGEAGAELPPAVRAEYYK